jgi:hypothetical protein
VAGKHCSPQSVDLPALETLAAVSIQSDKWGLTAHVIRFVPPPKQLSQCGR